MSKDTATITRREMKEPDKFQQAAGQAAGWISAHRKKVTAALVVGVVALLVLGAVLAWRAARAERAGAAAADLLRAVGGEISPVPLPGIPGPFFATEEEKQRAILTAADHVLAEYGGTDAADLAALAKGDAHLRLGELDPARAAYERFLSASDADDALRFGALEGVAHVEEAKGNLDAAAAAYERLAKELPAFADRADLERARVLARAGKADEAKKLLGDFAERHRESLLVPEAAQRLATLGGK